MSGNKETMSFFWSESRGKELSMIEKRLTVKLDQQLSVLTSPDAHGSVLTS